MFDSVAALPVNAIPVQTKPFKIGKNWRNKFIFAASVINISIRKIILPPDSEVKRCATLAAYAWPRCK